MRGCRLRMCLFWMWPVLGVLSIAIMWLLSGVRDRQRICFLCGGCLGLVAAMALMMAYIMSPRKSVLRQHPQPLIFWRCCADCYVALHFVIWALAETGDCRNVEVFFLEFAMIASEMWYFVSVHDMHASVHAPFLSKKTLMKRYHCIVWSSSLFMAMLLSLTSSWNGKYYVGGGSQASLYWYCYFNHKLLWPSWAFLYLPVLVLYFGCFALTILNLYGVWARIATHHTSQGVALSRVFAEHLHVLAINNANLVAVALYWTLFGGSYIISYLLVPRNTRFIGPSRNLHHFGSLSDLIGYGAAYLAAFLLPCKGCVDFMVWLLPLKPIEVAEGLGLSILVDTHERAAARTTTAASTSMSDELRSALSAEIFAYIRVGIVAQAESVLDQRNYERSIIELEPVVTGGDAEHDAQHISLQINDFITFASHALSPTSQHRDRLRALCCLDFDQADSSGRRLEARAVTRNESSLHRFRESSSEISLGSLYTAVVNLPDTKDTRTKPKVKRRFSWGRLVAFRSYCAEDFRRVRECYGISAQDYANSWQSITKARFNDGASGAFFIYSADERFIAKTTTQSELIALRHRANAYADYCCNAQGSSRLCRILGAHELRLYGRRLSFLVQENIFYATPSFESLRIYDVKGSWVNRHASQPHEGQKVNCKHCNQSYKFQRGVKKPTLSASTSTSLRRASLNEEPLLSTTTASNSTACFFSSRGHEPNIAGKDEDLNDTLQLDPAAATTLLEQLEHDSAFLAQHALMDYSLLIGVGIREYDVSNHQLLYSQQLNQNKLPQSKACRYDATVAIGPSSYTIAIIDVLQEYNMTKRFERCFKIVCRCNNRLGLSAIDPVRYQQRFMNRIYDIIPIRGPGGVLTPPSRLHRKSNTSLLSSSPSLRPPGSSASPIHLSSSSRSIVEEDEKKEV